MSSRSLVCQVQNLLEVRILFADLLQPLLYFLLAVFFVCSCVLLGDSKSD